MVLTGRFVTILFTLSSVVFLTLISIARIENLPCLWTLMGYGSINAFIANYLFFKAGKHEGARQALIGFRFPLKDAAHSQATDRVYAGR